MYISVNTLHKEDDDNDDDDDYSVISTMNSNCRIAAKFGPYKHDLFPVYKCKYPA
jgi:hypothetical protein